jgi:N-acetyl sugar amidotransferase
MEYCTRCLYPLNARPTIIFDEEDGVCSGCRYHESRESSLANIDWDEREKMFSKICEEAKKMARERGNSHDCIVPVSGGKDSQYQVWLLKKKYGMNPLLVTFNHTFNTPVGNKNLITMISKSGCDHIRYTAGLDSVRKLTRLMFDRVGDITWHFHAGIQTLPFRVAVEKNIPLIVWGEHGFAELTGLVTLEDFVEHTKWKRKEHDMRGFEAEDLLGQNDLKHADIAPYIYPSDEEIAKTGVRGIYISNFFKWNAKEHGELMMREWGFSPITYERDRTFNLYSKIEDHANDVHDYLKYLKFGYGRATDDASIEIRHGRMTREEGLKQVRKYDSRIPRTLEFYCDFMGLTVEEFYQRVGPMRDKSIWEQDSSGGWHVKDAVFLHEIGKKEESVRVRESSDRVFSGKNKNLYFNQANKPESTLNPILDTFPTVPEVF